MKLIPFDDVPAMVEKAKNGIAVQVIVNADDYEAHFRDNYYRMLGFTGKEKFKFCTILSEIANMPGHYVVIGNNSQIVPGLHSDIFYIDYEDIEDWEEVNDNKG